MATTAAESTPPPGVGEIVHVVIGGHCRPGLVLGQPAREAAEAAAAATVAPLAAARWQLARAQAARKQAQSAAARPVSVATVEEARAAVATLTAPDAADAAVQQAEAQVQSAESRHATTVAAAAATRDVLNLAIFTDGDRDAAGVNERIGGGGMPWSVPPVIPRADVRHDASGSANATPAAQGTWHRASECSGIAGGASSGQ